jgi:hypothetical protein
MNKLLFIVAWILIATSTFGQNLQNTAPDWLAWKMFHDSLAAQSQHSSTQVNQTLAAKFGLSTTQVATLLRAGQAFVGAIQQIDREAIAEIQKRYPDALPSSSHPRVTKTIPTGPQKSVRDRAIADGLYAQVEAKKQTALTDHVGSLMRGLDPAQVDQINKYMRSTIAPQIKHFNPPTGKGTPGLPPGIKQNLLSQMER